jgi:hypothetical protein
LWRWEHTVDGFTTFSAALFGTLAECVRDAQRHGFNGEVEPGQGAFAPGGYEINIADDEVAPASLKGSDKSI